ncbi:ABC transporter ATP-binding protein [Ruminiclostridium herbifermentans]|uniref:ABC transporter ATP-binding protein n=1 Tax=Ruminiclostridium herbifermentans TaxID=2488810 RepID=A0A4U7JJI1_9FIRM|nr:ABC transporter ATP-binding protein [Ruminiclostridium herbifermentans]QNU66227.1 ABC transporter ATP-binding protein [Ruminiclostridium herbifermentans]
MTLSKRTYKVIDLLRLIAQASPICMMLNIILSIIHTIMSTAIMALATANFVDTATVILKGERPHDDIYIPLFLLLLVLGVNTTIGAVVQLVGSRINLNLQRKLKPVMVRIHAALEFKHIENAESWELISRVSRDPIKSIMDGFGALIQFMQIMISVVSILILIVAHVWWAAITIIAFSTPMFILSTWAGKKNYQAGREAEKFNRRTEYLNEVLTGRDAVDERTLFGYGNNVSKRWQEQYEAGRILQLKVMAKTFIILKCSSLLLALIALLIALTLISPVVSGELSAGMYMGIVSVVFSLINQLGWQMSWALEHISKAGEYMRDLSAFIMLNDDEGALSEPDIEPISLNMLEFRNVRFRYPSSERYILDGLSFSLQAGRHYAFVGKNGAGKTTITKLITGLYKDYEGEILINGKELRQYPASTLKAMFSVVYQDFAKYYISLRDNIAIGNLADMTAPCLTDVIKFAGLDETIAELKDGIDTPLGKILEGGQDISGGQWQRIAIARSLNSRAPVKMLDEPTSALDPISESQIYSEFEKLMEGKTTVLISHRLGSTKLADEILVIDDGKVIERGTHDELMGQNGQYANMFEAQRGWYQ